MPKYVPKFEAVTTKLTHRMDYSDFEDVVLETYGHRFEFVADQESGNDTSHEFNRMLKQEHYDNAAFKMDAGERAKLERFVATGRGSFLARVILQDLVDHDVLPEGDYVIRVSW